MSGEQLTALYTDAMGLLKELIAIPSYSREEHGTAAAISKFFSAKGVIVNRYLNNIWVANKYFYENKPTILLN